MEQYVNRYQKNLRCGITTGTCAAAAAQAASMDFLLGIRETQAEIHTPKGVKVQVDVHRVHREDVACEYYVVKDSGDDPDVTNHCEVHVTLCWITNGDLNLQHVFASEEYSGLFLDGGVGIGRVTGVGLEQSIGQAAINTVPRKMIFDAVGNVWKQWLEAENNLGYERKRDNNLPQLLIEVSIPNGEELAQKTFNPRLGIEGGLSILGTSGILEPMSEKAIVDTIETEIRKLSVEGEKELLVTPGNYGQAYVRDYLGLELDRSVKCSNYIGETIDLAIGYGMTDFLLVGNIGKLVKLAAGIMNTHSKVADGRLEVFVTHTALAGGNQELLEKIMNSVTTEEILDLLLEAGLKEAVMERICQQIKKHLDHRIAGKMNYKVYIFSESKGLLGCVEG